MFNGLPVQYKQVTQAAAATVKSTTGDLYGVVVNSSTSGTVTVYDNTSATGTVVFTASSLTVGQVIHFGGCGIRCGNGIHVVVGGTATVNVLYQ
jgi:hypothetical protein